MRGFNPYLHGARGLFALMIVAFHVVNSGLPTFAPLLRSWPLFLLRSLEPGVELFFGISGIVIVGALSRARNPVLFAVERATRIYPVLWASVICIVILSGFSGFEGRGLPTLPVLVANLLGLPPVFPGPLIHPAAWSLSYELVFYGFCALAWALRRRLRAWSAVIIVPAALLLVGTHVRAVLMPVGMLIAVALARNPQWSRFSPAPGLCLIVFLLAWEGVYLLAGSNLTNLDGVHLSPATIGIAVVAILAAGSTFAGVLGGRGLLCALLNSRPMQFLGTISYSLYLWHPILMAMVKHAMYASHLPQRIGPFSQLAFLVLSLPVSVLIAWISQLVLEKRVTRWLRRRLEGRDLPKVSFRQANANLQQQSD